MPYQQSSLLLNLRNTGKGTGWNQKTRTAMAPKHKPQVQREGPEKNGHQGAEEEDSFRSTAEALRATPTEKHIAQVDPLCPLSCNPGTQVREDYDCILKQTNTGSNNKIYIIQLLEEGDCFICWNPGGA
ncbi:protein mono-ADP-ribosyltransferase PARP3-like isoform X3 [Kogia breviceps]